MHHKRKKRKIKTANGYLPGDGPRGNSRADQTKAQALMLLSIREAQRITEELQEARKVDPKTLHEPMTI